MEWHHAPSDAASSHTCMCVLQGQDETTMKRMKMAFRLLGVAMVPLTMSMPQAGFCQSPHPKQGMQESLSLMPQQSC